VVMANSLVWGSGIANFGTITKRKTADESVSSSTTLQDDDHLTFPIAANEEWTTTIQASYVHSAAGGVKAAVTVPSGATMHASVIGTGASFYQGATTTSGTAILVVSSGVGTDAVFKVWVLNGATPGNVTLQWAQNTSDGTSTTARKGSFENATRVA